MRVLVHDYSGHPFQIQLSRELARRGHDVLHSHCSAHSSGKGRLETEPDETLQIEAIGEGELVDKFNFAGRLVQEMRYGRQLLAQVRRNRPDIVLLSNVPIPMLLVVSIGFFLRRVPWVFWQQDVHSIAIASYAGSRLPKVFRPIGQVAVRMERWACHRARAIVVIASSFNGVHQAWGTLDKVTVIPNWAPLDEIIPVERHNVWSAENALDDVQTLLYSGTLGLKHNPALLVELAAQVIAGGTPVRLVVVNTGPAEEVLRAEAERLGVPLTLLPFQPYERLPEVLGAGDVLVVLLEEDAGSFSVPSKTLSYLCAGRPILGLMPEENLAAELVHEIDCCVLPPSSESLPAAADWIRALLADGPRMADLGKRARSLAEREFALAECGDKFEAILLASARRD